MPVKVTMNSPPPSFSNRQHTPEPSQRKSHQDHPNNLNISIPRRMNSNDDSPSLDTIQHNTGPPNGPPSPASTSSAIAVGSTQEAALIQSIERGEYAANDLDETRSLTDSIRQHIIDGGLRYHAYHAGQYFFPNDETEQYREDMKHNLTVYLTGGERFAAPVHEMLEKGAEVLDLGTGTGKWCIDLADEYPNSQFLGMDLSPIQPDWVPENCMFVVDDVEHEAGWTEPENKFDFIHIRHTLYAIKNRKEMWDRIYRHLKPGGYVEIQEFQYLPMCDDDSCDGPYAFRDYMRFMQDGLAALGSDMHGILYVEDELAQAGFENVSRQSFKCPTGPWPKKRRLQECGFVLRDCILWGLVGLSRKPLRDGLGWTPLQIEMHLVDVRKSLSAEVNGLPKYHSYYPYSCIFARKPLDSDTPMA